MRGTCSPSHQFFYTRGDIDFLPAGYDYVEAHLDEPLRCTWSPVWSEAALRT